MKKTYKKPAVIYDFAPGVKSKTIPDQSMSIQEIMKRYVRGVPADVVHKEPVYVDQSDYDLEKLGRLDPVDRSAIAQEIAERNQRIVNAAQEEQARRATMKQQQDEQEKARDQQRGIDPLDNTMPRDTNADN